ncbi:MAG: serine/threonine-protein kinase [Calditrichia bacterium]
MNSIGSYKILETLYDKGAVQACLAVHQKLGRKTFLKIYSGLDAGLIRRFEREARIVADLDHESIVSIYDFGEDQGRYYIAMEFVDGWNLAQYLQSHELMDEEILDIAYQIAASVAVLHRKGYIHRDLKPENVLIGRNKKIKITDFGTSFQASQVRMTQNGDLNGTPLYMSPEQINNLQITASSDVFTLGIIFYQLATGIHPFYAEQYGEIFARILTLEPLPINSIRDTIPEWFSDLVSMLLQKDASKRPKNAQEVAAEMKSRNIISDIPQLQQRTPFRYTNIKRKAIIFPLLLGLKVWTWSGDPIAKETFSITRGRPGRKKNFLIKPNPIPLFRISEKPA